MRFLPRQHRRPSHPPAERPDTPHTRCRKLLPSHSHKATSMTIFGPCADVFFRLTTALQQPQSLSRSAIIQAGESLPAIVVTERKISALYTHNCVPTTCVPSAFSES